MAATGPEQWREIEALFEQAIALGPEDRVRFVRQQSSGPGVREELLRLLAAHESAGAFLEQLDTTMAGALLRSFDRTFEEGERVGPYRVSGRLGSGGMGIVLLAHDPRLDREVALKLLPWATGDASRAAETLRQEARSASALDHPNIVTIYDIGETESGDLYVAMAHHEGRTLGEVLAAGPLSVSQTLGIAEQVASGLSAAHEHRIVHRDVKPANLIVTDDGTVKIVDFGIATAIGGEGASGRPVGTVAYMSPEQLDGSPIDGRTDLWALGVVLYECLAGRRPFEGGDVEETMASIRAADPTPIDRIRSDVPDRLAGLVHDCLSRDPDERPADAATALEALAEISRRHARPRERVAPRWVASAAALILIAGTAWILGPWGDRTPPFPPPSGTRVAVVPFVTTGPDSTLERVGRDLAVSLGAVLDGTAGIHAIEPTSLLAQPEASGAPPSREEALALARRLGADVLVSGTLVRADDGTRVRAELSLLAPDGSEPQGRVTARASNGALNTLTDSIGVGLLRQLSGASGIQAPNLAAVTTSSLEALGAYLAGERAIALGQFRAAPTYFAEAIAADSTFWFAYWRYAYARGYHGEPVDSTIRRTIVEHRETFPEPDRLLVEARMATGQRERLDGVLATTRLHPDYWPAWFELGDLLSHHGPYLGRPRAETRASLETVLELNPNFVPALEHLFWAEYRDTDTIASGRSLARLMEIRLDTLKRREWNLDTLEYYRCLDLLARSNGQIDRECTAAGVADLAGYAGPQAAERLALSLLRGGFPEGADELADSILATGGAPAMLSAQFWVKALAASARGAGEQVAAYARRYASEAAHPYAGLWAYGLSVADAWRGQIEPASAVALRNVAVEAPAAGTARGAAELAWLDGVLAILAGDSVGVDAAVGTLNDLTTGSLTERPALRRSLEALRLMHEGDSVQAGRALADLEREMADGAWQFRFGSAHPFVNSVNRLAGARALLAAGDTTEAATLLLWHEWEPPGRLHPLGAVNVVFGTAALFELGRIDAARGRMAIARRRLETFLERYDQPGEDHRWMVERARDLLSEVGGAAGP